MIGDPPSLGATQETCKEEETTAWKVIKVTGLGGAGFKMVIV